jgi:hypothetical protein
MNQNRNENKLENIRQKYLAATFEPILKLLSTILVQFKYSFSTVLVQFFKSLIANGNLIEQLTILAKLRNIKILIEKNGLIDFVFISYT